MLLNEILNTVNIDQFYYIGESTDAKLYDVSYYSCSQDLDPFYFNDFCNIEFYFFKDYLKDVGAALEFIGRTSSFYFISSDIIFYWHDISMYAGCEPAAKREILFDEFLYYTGAYDTLGEMIDAGWGVDEIKREWAQYCADVLTPINEAWNYLKVFKENQLTNFIEYMEAA